MKELLNRLNRLYRIRKEKILLILGAVMTMGILASCECESDTSPKSPDPTSVGFKGTSLTLEEDAGTIDVTVEIEEALTGDINLNVSTMDMSANSGSDYTAISEEVIISEGDTSITFPLTILDDGEVEEDETFKLVLSASDDGLPRNLNLTNSEVVVTINDNDTRIIAFSPLTMEDFDEATGTIMLTVSNSQALVSETVTLDISLTPDTATADDYAENTVSITFTGAETSKTVSVDIVDDSIVELTETFTVTLSVPPDGALPDATRLRDTDFTVNILDDDTAEVSFASSMETVGEGAGSLTLEAMLDKALPEDLTLTFTDKGLDPNPATGGMDYTLTTTSITIPRGDLMGNVSIDIIDDATLEIDEQFKVTITDKSFPPGTLENNKVTIASDGRESATVTIDDNDNTVGFTNASPVFEEDMGTVNVTVELEQPLTESLSLNVSTMDMSATSNSDYTAISGMTVTIPRGDTSITFSLTIIDDVEVEVDETFKLVLSASGGLPGDLNFGNQEAIVTINDNDTRIIDFSPLTMGEFDEATGTIMLTVSNSQALVSETVTLSISLTPGTATADDYTKITETITFTGTAMSNAVSVNIVNDDIVELTETFTVTLSVSGALPAATRLRDTVFTVNILDDDTAEVSFASSMETVGEGAGSFTTLEAILDKALPEDLTLTFTAEGLSPNPATGGDYTLTTSITIPRGDLSGNVSIDIIDDAILELDEQFKVTITDKSFSSGTLENDKVTIASDGRESATVTIDDNDNTVGFTNARLVFDEDIGIVNVTVELGLALTESLSLNVSTMDMSAMSGSDYTAISEMEVMIPGGDTSITFPLTIVDDGEVEKDETFRLVLSTSSGGDLPGDLNFGIQEAIVTINNDDMRIIAFSPTMGEFDEDAGTIMLTVSNSDPLFDLETVTLNISLTPGTATADDYTKITETITFTGTAMSNAVSVNIVNDDIVELTETFTVTLSVPPGGSLPDDTILGDSDFTVNIRNDDIRIIAFSPTMGEFDEDAGTIMLTVSNSDPLFDMDTVTLDISLIPGTATADDYTENTMSITFTGTEMSKTVSVDIENDDIVEVTETFTVTLSLPSVGSLPDDTILGDSDFTVNIRNDDMATLSLSRTPPRGNVEEGGSVTLTASLSGGKTLADDLPILIEISGDAESSDYSFPSGMARIIIIPAGTSEGMVELNIEDDSLIEPEETLEVTMNSEPINSFLDDVGLMASINIANPPVEIVITDTDMASLGFTMPAISIAEGDSGSSTPVTLTVSLSGAQLAEPLSITVATVDGTATNGEDYTAVNQTLNFPSMTPEIDIPIMITGDNSWGLDETFQVELSATDKPAGVTLGEQSATVTIVNDDTVDLLATYRTERGRPVAERDIGTRNIAETTTEPLKLYFFIRGPSGSGATESEMIINLEQNMDLSIVASASVLDGRPLATLGEDFTAPSPSPVIFPSGSLIDDIQTATIGIINDAVDDNNEVLSYRIITQPGVTLVPLSAFTGGGGIVEEANNNFRFALIFRN